MRHSKTEIAQWLVNAIARHLDVSASPIQTDVAFESFAIESVVLFQITGELADWMGVELDASLIWDHPNIESLASFLAGEQSARQPLPTHVVDFQGAGTMRPVFFVSGLGGHPRRFATLATHIGERRPTFGLKVPGFGGDTPRADKLETLASTLIGDLRTVQPSGPYQLLGYSFGGLVAYEMAIQLHAQGHDVGFLGILDTAAPGAITPRPWWQRFVIHLRQRILKSSPKTDEPTRDYPSALQDAEAPNDLVDASATMLIEQNIRCNEQLQDAYSPGPWHGDLVLFTATRHEPENEFVRIKSGYGWTELAKGTVNSVPVPGTHLSMLCDENVWSLAQAIEPWLVE